ncbi:Pr6Pr family membrane protein [Nocardioides sp.]|uniref:Pr6Pr family membrane protein n=1 Tax=Nocardioides sp. TaxID=35761 RepID=UPI001A1A88D4|nr:Pr6Pr family membrane protein [Nocardioides sp.]MBJ7357513.1 Pr6Pr family membrane protein [Nocardioides sp.]
MHRARAWHAVTGVVAIAALVLQLVLVMQGGRVLDETDQPGLGVRLARFVAYFTVQSNVLVALTSVHLARDPARDGPAWRAVRLAAVVGISVTGVVHFVLLRPLLDLEGADYAADKLLHMAVPVLAVAGWAVFGPRPRIDLRSVRLALCWPLAWLAVTLVVGGASGWYPYPFLDHREDEGVAGVVASSAGITVFFLLLVWLAGLYDRRAKVAP